MPKYPAIKVKLTGVDGNAFSIIGTVRNALKKAKVSDEEIKFFTEDAMSGDYNNVLTTCMEWVDVR